MELRDYLRIVRRRWMVIVLTVLLTVGAAALLTFTATPQYASSARLFVSTAQGNTSEAYQGGLFSAERVTSYADLLSSRQLAATVANDLGGDVEPEALSGRVTAEVVPETVILELTAQDADPAEAQLLAQTYAEAMVDLVRELETPPGQTVAPIKATIVDPASRATMPVSPQPVRNLGLGLVLGLLLGVGLAVVRELLDTSITSPGDVGEATEAPLMGNIAYDQGARSQPLVTSLDSHAPRVEAFRVLRTNLQFVDVDVANKVFVVTSALPGEGKTTTAVNLALTLAQTGTQTLLMECDLRRPKALELLGLDNAVGLTTVLVGKVDLDDVIQVEGDSGLHLLGSGAVPPNPAELLQSNAMDELLKEVRDRYEYVIIDAPPLLPVTDAALLTAQSDGSLLVVRHGKTTKDQLEQAVDRLRQVDAEPIGVVMNMTPAKGRRSGYGYGYGYGYAPQQTEKQNKGPGARGQRRATPG